MKKGAIIAIIIVLALLAGAAGGGYYYYANYYLPEVRETERANQLIESYNAAVELLEQDEYEQATAAFEALGDYKDSAARAEDAAKNAKYAATYAEAERLIDEGKYQEAVDAFRTIMFFKDANKRAQEVFVQYLSPASKLKALELGDTISMYGPEAGLTVADMGEDEYTFYFRETIPWKLIAKEGDRLLLAEECAEPLIDRMFEPYSWIVGGEYVVNMFSYNRLSEDLWPYVNGDIFLPDREFFKNYIQNNEYAVFNDNYAYIMVDGEKKKDSNPQSYFVRAKCSIIGTDKKINGAADKNHVFERHFIWLDLSKKP